MESKALRDVRPKLVTTAHEIMGWAFRQPSVFVRKTQLTHLVSVCGEASCAEEIDAYVRYQSSRKQDGKPVFGTDLAERILSDIVPILKSVPDAEKTIAWKLYAVFLAREFTYFDARRRANAQHDTHAAAHRGGRR